MFDFRLLIKRLMYNNCEHFKCSNTTVLSRVLCPISWFTCGGIVVNLSYMKRSLDRRGRSFILKSHIYVIITSANVKEKSRTGTTKNLQKITKYFVKHELSIVF